MPKPNTDHLPDFPEFKNFTSRLKPHLQAENITGRDYRLNYNHWCVQYLKRWLAVQPSNTASNHTGGVSHG